MLVKKINVKDIVSNRVGAVYDSYPNQNKYKAPVNPKLRAVNHTDKVKIDPDNQLSKEDRDDFKRLCEEFQDVIRPDPGRYNGH